MMMPLWAYGDGRLTRTAGHRSYFGSPLNSIISLVTINKQQPKVKGKGGRKYAERQALNLPLITISLSLSLMAGLACVALVLAMTGGSEAAWCVCKPEMADVALQKTLDCACGAGADCIAIHQNGVCWNPNTVRAHCSYAANSYFQRKGQGTKEPVISQAMLLSPPQTQVSL
ncbi:unnamed protein product [Musa acuminata subsp. burmannicoides]